MIVDEGIFLNLGILESLGVEEHAVLYKVHGGSRP